MTTPPGALQSLAAARERAVRQLGEAFAADAFEMDELESRLARVYRAASIAEVEALVQDVAPATTAAPLPVPSGAPLLVRSLLSSTRRAGRWIVPPRLEVRALLGDVTIDLRDAELPEGGCEIVVRSTLANVTIVVAPGTAVDTSVSAVLANVEDVTPLAARARRDGPRVRVTGRALLANVEVKALPTGVAPDED